MKATPYQLGQRAVAFAFLLILAALALLGPAGTGGAQLHAAGASAPLPDLCGVRAATGEPCPGCGLTRGMVAGLRFDLAGARRQHASAPGLLALLLAQVLLRPLLSLAPLAGRGARLAVLADFGLTFGLVLWILAAC